MTKPTTEYWVRAKGGRVFAKTPYLDTFPPVANATGGTWLREHQVWWWHESQMTVNSVRQICISCYGLDFTPQGVVEVEAKPVSVTVEGEGYTLPEGAKPTDDGFETTFAKYLAWKTSNPQFNPRVVPTWYDHDHKRRQRWGDPTPMVAILAEHILALPDQQQRTVFTIVAAELKEDK